VREWLTQFRRRCLGKFSSAGKEALEERGTCLGISMVIRPGRKGLLRGGGGKGKKSMSFDLANFVAKRRIKRGTEIRKRKEDSRGELPARAGC